MQSKKKKALKNFSYLPFPSSLFSQILSRQNRSRNSFESIASRKDLNAI